MCGVAKSPWATAGCANSFFGACCTWQICSLGPFFVADVRIRRLSRKMCLRARICATYGPSVRARGVPSLRLLFVVGDNHWTSDVSACCVAYKLADGKEMRFVAWT